MPFPLNVRLQALIACQRHCCLCHERKHTRLQCHHILPEADGGPNTSENCIPLCPDCHAEVLSFNPRHPFGGTPYHRDELIRRRDDWYAVVERRSHDLAERLHQSPLQYPSNPAMSGRAAFDYSNHNGFFCLGSGNCEFLTRWSKASNTSIYCRSDKTNLDLAVASPGTELSGIPDASLLDFTSRVPPRALARLSFSRTTLLDMLQPESLKSKITPEVRRGIGWNSTFGLLRAAGMTFHKSSNYASQSKWKTRNFVLIPIPGKPGDELAPGTQNSILKQAGLK